jgi:hypothetical protein
MKTCPKCERLFLENDVKKEMTMKGKVVWHFFCRNCKRVTKVSMEK